MKMFRVLLFFGWVVCFAAAAGPCLAEEAAERVVPTALQDYVAQADDSFSWKLIRSEPLAGGLGGTLHEVELVSQTWQGILWKHVLVVFEPVHIRHKDHALLFITGGKTGSKLRDGDKTAGALMAASGGFCVGYLLHVPNQPLLGDRFEDDLVTETFLRYLDTKDPTWPLLFPMVKSAVRAMDAIQGVAQEKWDGQIEKFVVSGASKRGWTTWLSAVADPRVAGIAPLVIDTLNFQPQMKHQIDVWGKYSPQIEDYTSKGLVQIMEERPEIPLWRWVDPYTYRQQLTLPKLIVNGTNDPYWVVDALNLYWDGLPGPKHILYIPNAGHGLEGGIPTALASVVAFVQHVAQQKPLPKLQWKYQNGEGKIELTVQSDVRPNQVKLWQATSETGDFRPSTWTSSPISVNGEGKYVATVDIPDQGNIALYAEATFPGDSAPFSLTTQIHRQ